MFTSRSPSIPPEAVKALLISSLSDDKVPLQDMFDRFNWLLHRVSTCSEAFTYLDNNDPAVVICERDLPDGDWKFVLNRFESLPTPPNLIVTSRLANDGFWAEVLNLGGYDVLVQPFDPQEVHRIILLACDERRRRIEVSARRSSGHEGSRARSRATT
jgi:DNA-binding response OmpR family regulator